MSVVQGTHYRQNIRFSGKEIAAWLEKKQWIDCEKSKSYATLLHSSTKKATEIKAYTEKSFLNFFLYKTMANENVCVFIAYELNKLSRNICFHG